MYGSNSVRDNHPTIRAIFVSRIVTMISFREEQEDVGSKRRRELKPPVAFPRQEDHVGIRVKEGDKDARGHVEGEKVLWA